MIAIQNSKIGFHPYWIEYCKKNNIPFKLVNCYDNDIINQLQDCKILFWHHHHNGPKDLLIAKQLLYALEHTGFKVFPDFKTGWHFDDKIAQKYLFERIEAPLIASYVFLDKKEAIDWANITSFPKVFKLRGGAGSTNVKLVKNKEHAKKIINKAFDYGFKNYNALESLKERWRKYKLGKVSLLEPLKGFARLFIRPKYTKIKGKEFGYLYFQDYIPNLICDYRIIVISNKIFAIKRFVRENDFRASGSGILAYEPSLFPIEMLELAKKISTKLKLQSAAFDFIIDKEIIKLVEVSYGFPTEKFANDCPGYWNEDLIWQEGKFNPYGWMIESELESLKSNS